MDHRSDRGAVWRAAQEQAGEDAAARARATTRPVFREAATYVAAHPEGTRHLSSAHWRCPVALLPLLYDTRWGALPGGYLLAAVVTGTDGAHWVGVYDHDDGEWRRACPSVVAAVALLDELCALAPLDPPDLAVLGFEPG